MYVESRPFLCRQCNERFNLETLQDVIVDVWVRHIKTLRCPQCGATWRKLSFVSDVAAKVYAAEVEGAAEGVHE